MANEGSKTVDGPLLPPPPPSVFESVGLRSRGTKKDSPVYIQDTSPAEDVRRTRSSGCWLCGCDGDHDVIPPPKASPTTTNSLNRRRNDLPDLAPDLNPAGAAAVVDYLRTYHGFPTGLIKTLVNLEVLESVPWRIVLVDCSTQVETATVTTSTSGSSSSSSMHTTHWQDVGESLSFIAGLARTAHAITDFRLGSEVMPPSLTANPMVFAKTAALPTPLVVGDPSEQDGSASLHARLGLATHNADTPGLASGTNSSSNSNNRPGRTALCRDLMDVVAEITENEQALGQASSSPPSSSSSSSSRSRSIRASVIIVTDSIPADGEVLTALKALELLPVNVVVRLCTNDSVVAAFWGAQRDKVPHLLMEVLHGPHTEAAHRQGLAPGSGLGPGLGPGHDSASKPGLGLVSGPWLAYAEPLHRLREFGLVGVHVGALDIEQDLAPVTMHRLVAFLFGLRSAQLPLPAVDWSGFVFVTNLLNQKDMSWLDMQALAVAYGPAPDPNTFGNRARSKGSTATAMSGQGDNLNNNNNHHHNNNKNKCAVQ